MTTISGHSTVVFSEDPLHETLNVSVQLKIEIVPRPDLNGYLFTVPFPNILKILNIELIQVFFPETHDCF